MECRSCGNTVSADAKFRSQCGDKVPELVNNPTEAVGQLSPLDEQTIRINQLFELVAANVRDLGAVKTSALKAFVALQNADKTMAQVMARRWFPFGLPGQTGKVFKQLASELRVSYTELHSKALTTENPMAEGQAKALANLISVAIEAANTVGMYYDAPYASLSVQQALHQLEQVSRELASFLK